MEQVIEAPNLNVIDSVRDNVTKISEMRKELKKKKKYLKKRLEEQSAYMAIDEEVKQFQKDRREIKDKVIKENEDMNALDSDIKRLNLDIKMRNIVLSEDMLSYEKETGQLMIPGIELTFEKVIRPKWSTT